VFNEMEEKKRNEWKLMTIERRKNLPSPSGHVDENKPFTMEKLLPRQIELKSKQQEQQTHALFSISGHATKKYPGVAAAR